MNIEHFTLCGCRSTITTTTTTTSSSSSSSGGGGGGGSSSSSSSKLLFWANFIHLGFRKHNVSATGFPSVIRPIGFYQDGPITNSYR